MINKKIMRFPLLLAVAIALLAVGCSKDYGADISDLRKDLNSTQAQLAKDLDQKVQDLNGRITTINDAIAKLNAADKDLQNLINKVKDDSAKAIAEAEARAIAQAKKDLEVTKLALQTQIDALEAVAKANKALIDKNTSDIKKLTADLSALKKSVEENAKKIGLNEAEIKALSESVEKIQALVAENKKLIDQNATDIKTLNELVAKNTAAIEANYKAAVAYTDTEIAKVSARINALSASLTSLESRVDALELSGEKQSAAIEEIKKNVEKLQKDLADLALELDKEIARLEGLIDVNTQNIKDLSEKLTKLELQLNALEELVDANKSELEGKIESTQKALEKEIAAVQDALDAYKLEMVETLKGYVDNATFDSEITRINTEINNIKSQLADRPTNKELQEKLEALEAKLEAAWKAADTALETKLQSKIDGLSEQIDALDKRIEILERKIIQITDVIGLDDSLNLLKARSLRITSMVIIPDVVAKEGGSLPIVDFGNILFENACDGGVTSNEATLKFRVSPSNAATPAIEDLKFYFNTPQLRATEDKNLVEEITAVSLNKGVMMVTFTVNKARAVDGVTRDNQIQLAVSYYEEDVVDPIEVSSDWARVTFTDYALALGRTAHEALGDTGLQVLPNTLAKAKLATTPAYPVFYDAETDLLEIARTLLADKTPLVEFKDNSKYGLDYVFDLLDENGKPIKFDEGDNKTNQQEYIVLNGTVVTAKVWTLGGNKVAIDKTPIVRVRLMNGNCVAAMAFIKLVFTEEEIPAVKPEVVHVSKNFGTLEASCEAKDYKLSVQEMNEWIYYPENLTYKDFHDKFDIRAKSGSEFANVRFIPDTEFGTETQPVTITIDPTTQAKNIGKTITIVAEIFEKDRPDYVHFELTFALNIITETVYVERFLNMWDAKDRGLINTEVPAPENNNEISPNLNNLFRLDKPNINLTIRDNNGKAITDASYGYEYVFDQAKNNGRLIKGIEDATFTLSVSADGKTLFAKDASGNSQEVATITDSTSPDKGDIFTYAKTEFAKSILNAGAENVNAFIAIKTTKCDGGTPTTIKSLNGNLTDGKFEVIVRRPVNMTAEAKDHFIDGLDKGEEGTFFNVGDIVELTDWRNRPFTQSTLSAEGVNYWTYYGIGIFTIDPTAIKYQSEKDGPLLPLQNTMIVEYDSTTGVLSWLNNGNAVTKPIYLNVPVVIPHKWGELHGTFIIEVRPTSEAMK